ncbi:MULTISPECIES: high-affinity branched-chain amino acid ABC transporter permease LivM [Rhodomicrobium]|uniref:high-affinity branched-chain amino acid ABC transporter permease LivM n=1 Tax=Rhodomicrobium TaxID=1068 RepID=UPI000B4B48A9|nr:MULTISPECIES: high-affinity branched-chain amino acid ABC transporter permease LivM [Rhodomicrobium]
MAEGVVMATGARSIEAPDVGEALKQAIIASGIALILFIAIVGIKTENAQGGLALIYRFGAAFSLAATVGVVRFLFDLFVWRGLGREIMQRWLPAGTLGTVMTALVIAAYLLGAYYFIVPGSRLALAETLSDIFGDNEWRSRSRIFVELTGQLVIAVFIVLSAMGIIMALRRLFSAAIPASREAVPPAARAEKTTLAEFGQQFAPALLVIAVILPVLVAGPQQRYALDTAIQILTYIMLGWGLNIVVGLAGLLDLGYVAFYAVGAYSYALLSTSFGWSFWICLPLAGILAAFWGIMLGFPVLRLRGDYLAIVTLAFGEMIRILLLNWQSLTNGPNGISQIPKPSFFGLSFDRFGGSGTKFHEFFGLQYDAVYRIIFLYYIILALALMVNFASQRLRRLPIGRAWEALREDEIACRSLGINTVTTKLTAFAIGAMFGGFAGSFFAMRQGFISPESFTFHESALILAIVVLGGLGSQIGVVVAAVALIGSSEFFRDLEDYRMLIFGASMVVIMVWRPRGLVSGRAPTVVLKEHKVISGGLVKEGAG